MPRDDLWIAIQGPLCATAEQNGDETLPVWDRALSVLVLIHEAYHARAWGGRFDEARVECRAIRHFRVGAKLLGATQQQADDLMLYGLAWHFLFARPGMRYYSPWCQTPEP